MKTPLQHASLLAIAGLTLAIGTQSAQASERKKEGVTTPTVQTESTRKAAGNNRRNPSTGGTDGKETGTLTGSHIKTTYTVHGHHTDAAQPVYIIDRNDPRFAKSGTVSGGLRGSIPFGTVRGGF